MKTSEFDNTKFYFGIECRFKNDNIWYRVESADFYEKTIQVTGLEYLCEDVAEFSVNTRNRVITRVGPRTFEI